MSSRNVQRRLTNQGCLYLAASVSHEDWRIPGESAESDGSLSEWEGKLPLNNNTYKFLH